MLAYPFLFILLLPLHNRDKNEINHQKNDNKINSPVIVHPMDILSEFDILVLRVDCQDEMSTDKCTRLINEQDGCSANNEDTTLLVRCRRSCFECNSSHQVVYWNKVDNVAGDHDEDKDVDKKNESNNGEEEHDDDDDDDDDDEDNMEKEKEDTHEEEGKKENGGPGRPHEYEEL